MNCSACRFCCVNGCPILCASCVFTFHLLSSSCLGFTLQSAHCPFSSHVATELQSALIPHRPREAHKESSD